MWVIATSATGAAVDVGGPWRAVAGVVSEAGERQAEALVASEAERDAAVLARSVRHGRDAGLGRELVIASETKTVIAQVDVRFTQREQLALAQPR